MADATHSFGQISYGSRGAVSQGQLKITPSGFVWKRAGGGKTVEVKKDDVQGVFWTKVSKGCQLGVRRKEGTTANFLGFRDQDYEQLDEFCKQVFGTGIQHQELSTSGRNWGSVALHGSSLQFLVDGKVAFEVALPDVSQAQQAKDELMLEFHVDDTAGDVKEDQLVEMAFHVPPTNPEFAAAGGSDANAAKALLDGLMHHTDAGASASDDAVYVFEDVAVIAPRGRFALELHLGALKLVGQTQDFKIRYASITRLFILPKANTPHTLVVVSLDPPIRKGQTFYSHLLCNFPTEEVTRAVLDISQEQLEAKNEKHGGKLQPEVSGYTCEVFAKILRDLSGCKLTKPGTFRNATDDGCCVRCSYKADDGYLYPLERAFFYVHKPPLLIVHDEIASVEFQRQGTGVLSSSVRTFDLVIRTRNEVEHQFRNIQRGEWQNLFNFITAKRIKVENYSSAQHGPAGAVGGALDVGDDVDPGLRAAAAEAGGESDEEDEDFEGGSADSSEEISGEGSESGSDEAEMVAEEGIGVDDITGGSKSKSKKRKASEAEAPAAAPKPKKITIKKPLAPKPAAAPTATGEGAEDGGGGKAVKAKKPRKKKDPNAPKKALSAFMYFSNASRERVKQERPGIGFGEIGKVLGEEWKALAPEDKVQYEEKAAQDKERYAAAMAAYKGAQGNGAEPAGADEEGAQEGSEGGDDWS